MDWEYALSRWGKLGYGKFMIEITPKLNSFKRTFQFSGNDYRSVSDMATKLEIGEYNWKT